MSVWAPGTAPLPPKAWSGRGIRPTRLRREPGNESVAVKALAMTLPTKAWRTVTWREGTNNELSSRFAGVRVRPAHRDYLITEMRPEEWLLIEWPQGEAEPDKILSYYRPKRGHTGANGVCHQGALAHRARLPGFEAGLRAGPL